jgi:hypothetical protein
MFVMFGPVVDSQKSIPQLTLFLPAISSTGGATLRSLFGCILSDKK